ncbi:NADPH-dependent 1-acyl dihydroxyacetone phosphate reductase [Elasticomyces elasticus]|nr:NADPH-dependent 1-acyl dihydroxyacetone phosphate reductase [Elasticomyces elasticus]KAK3666921.1 NADPH-dependent 1-acyl dihydroxyacetone phosphate reductase [Elasticomyces elasticus]KAK4933377.1 NADPH-dependent 1-acyl dihydroxyacetone phosphate reductase [Elasticomyces elasticus]
MANSRRTVLITGCSDGGMGAALAKEFSSVGQHVYATARDLSKMSSLSSSNIRMLELDIQSESSITDCVKSLPSLDILINNAGVQYTMPVVDASITEAKRLFDTNVWGNIALTQAFLPLLLSSPNAMIVNHTSVGSGLAIPFQAAYNASKAAMSMFSDTLRLELQPFDILVVNLKTGGVKTNVIKNLRSKGPELTDNSIYAPAKETVEKALRMEYFDGMGITAEQWAKVVVADLLQPRPPPNIWRGEWDGQADDKA